MGKPMAKNLLAGGVELMVCDLDETAVAELMEAGAVQGSYQEIGEQCEVVLLILPNGDISKAVLFGDNGVAAGLSAGKVVCDMSSITPVESKECYDGLAKIGVGFVDAPVSGGEPGAINGTLAFMAGGDKKDFDALMPYFDIMGS
ncbi:MAG: NAD(P)-binding domain-containing protein [Eubacterium aggregans]